MENTILILGAGASIPYKFPKTEQLRKDIINEAISLTNENELRALQLDRNEIVEFQLAFKSSLSFIDQFLEDNEKYLRIGKIILAKAIAKYENPKTLFEISIDEDWYRFLIDSITKPDINFKLLPLTIFTFNYDRSLEYYLFRVLKSRYAMSFQECQKQLKRIKIYHFYGSLGPLPWQVEESDDSKKVSSIEYGQVLNNYDNIINAANSLKVIYERDNNNRSFEILHELYSNHFIVFFLGFGFNEINLTRLQLDKYDEMRFCGGTSINIGKIEKDNINKISKGMIRPEDLKDTYIIDFFKNHFSLVN